MRVNIMLDHNHKTSNHANIPFEPVMLLGYIDSDPQVTALKGKSTEATVVFVSEQKIPYIDSLLACRLEDLTTEEKPLYKDTQKYNIIFRKKLAVVANKCFNKGDKVCVDGRVVKKNYSKLSYKIVVKNLYLLTPEGKIRSNSRDAFDSRDTFDILNDMSKEYKKIQDMLEDKEFMGILSPSSPPVSQTNSQTVDDDVPF